MFPSAPQPSLTREQVMTYLLDWQKAGFPIYSEKLSDQKNAYTICFNSITKITVRESQVKNTWDLQLGLDGRRIIGEMSDLDGLRNKLESVALQYYNIKITDKPRSIQIYKGFPASNLVAIKSLIGNTTVLAIFDPFLDDKAIENLIVLRNLDVQFSSNLKLLTSIVKIKESKLSKKFVEDFLTEINANTGETRFHNDSAHQGRYIFLSNGQVVFTGGSLNNLNTNERAHVDDCKGIDLLFNEIWKVSTPFVVPITKQIISSQM